MKNPNQDGKDQENEMEAKNEVASKVDFKSRRG